MPQVKKVHIPVLHKTGLQHKSSRVKIQAITKPKQKAFLTYYASTETLSGNIGNIHFNEKAYSGGSRGHKKVSKSKALSYLHAEADTMMSRLATTPLQEHIVKGKKGKKDTTTFIHRGGAIPSGHYICRYKKNHPPFHECIFLEQQKDALSIKSPFSMTEIVHKRGGFYIHGAGPKGSDGCLVFDEKNDERRKLLNKTIHDFDGEVILEVINNSYMLPAEIGGYTV